MYLSFWLKSGMRDVEGGGLIRMTGIGPYVRSMWLPLPVQLDALHCVQLQCKWCRYEVPWGGEKMASLKGGPCVFSRFVAHIDKRFRYETFRYETLSTSFSKLIRI